MSQKPSTALAAPPHNSAESRRWAFRLYVAGMSPTSRTALANLQRICAQHLPDQHELEVVDLLAHPERAEADRVLAVPMLLRIHPEPARRIVGDLSTTEQVLASLDLPLEP